MSEEKKKYLAETAGDFNNLPEAKQNYVLGYMNGVLDAEELSKKEPEKES